MTISGSSSNNLFLLGTLYVVDGAVLTLGGYTSGTNGRLIVCEDSGFSSTLPTNSKTTKIYNFGWMEICGDDVNRDSIWVGENSITAFQGTTVEVDEFIYQGSTENAYIFIDPSTP